MVSIKVKKYNLLITKKKLIYTLFLLKFSRRCPKQVDAEELFRLRIKIDCETENLDREPGEGLLSSEDLKRIIYEDSISRTSLLLIAEVNSKIVGFTRCEGNKLSRFKHKAEFGLCILMVIIIIQSLRESF